MIVPMRRDPASTLTLLRRSYDHPDAAVLVRDLHSDQLQRYGFADHPEDNDAADFEPPPGLFLVGYQDGRPIACGGYRRLPGDSTVEIKRMFVQPDGRGRGYGRLLLHALEGAAERCGARRVILETGARNVEALRLYLRAGYCLIPGYVGGRNPDVNRALGRDLVRRSGTAPAGSFTSTAPR